MSITELSESWLQEVAQSIGLPSLSPEVCECLLPHLDMELKCLLQDALKFQKKSKALKLSVSDINLVLQSNEMEPLYALHSNQEDFISNTTNQETEAQEESCLNLVDFIRKPLPKCPILPSLGLHWLAVAGSQPMIPQNPSFIVAETEKQPVNVPQELQNLYNRITGIILNYDESNISSCSSLLSVYDVLKNDQSLQDLLPYFSHFFYVQIKKNTKNLNMMKIIIKCISLLHENPSLSLEAHLPQLLPAIFTCIVSSKLCHHYKEDHWSLRLYSAELISDLNKSYSSFFPDLNSRIIKTFLEAITQKKKLTTLYGGIIGLNALGPLVISSILFNELQGINEFLTLYEKNILDIKKNFFSSFDENNKDKKLDDNSSMELEETEKDKMNQKILSKYNNDAIKFNEHIEEEQLMILMIKDAIKVSLGTYMIEKMKKKNIRGEDKKIRQINIPLCDLEESLVPYYSSQSNDLYHCGLIL